MSYYIEVNVLDDCTDATIDTHKIPEVFEYLNNAVDYCDALIIRGSSTIQPVGREYTTKSVCLQVRDCANGKLMREKYGRMPK